jgi:predicted dehydrogenase
MKILSIGGGSMGRRRLRDLTYLTGGDVILFEPVEERCREISEVFGVPGYTSFEEALAQKPEAITISTPPALHEQYVRRAVEMNLPVFSELPFVLDVKSLAEIEKTASSYSGVFGISHTIRYYPPFRLIHDLLRQGRIGKPLYLEYSLGNYLPDWHPYEDYRKFYASDVRLGGAGMDMILHELSPIQWWLGEIETVYARLSKLSSLEINGPDNHDVLISFANGTKGFFHHDVIERGTIGRHVRIAGEDGTIEWHQNQPTIRVFRGDQNHEVPFEEAADWDEAIEASQEMSNILAQQRARSGQPPSATTGSFTYESCYLREMRHFLDAASKRAPYVMTNIQEELQTVKTFHAIVRSSEEKREIKVDEVEVH